MKTIFITNIFPHYRRYLLRALIDEGLIDEICYDPNDLPSIAKVSHRPFIELSNIRIKGYLVYQKNVLRALSLFKPDQILITCEVSNISFWLVLLYSRVFSIKCITWGHGLYGKEFFVLKKMRLLAARLAHTNLVYGHRAKTLFEAEGIKNVDVVFNSIGNSRTDKITPFKGLMTIVYIGRILKDRKLDMLLDLVEFSNLNLQVKIFGNGEYREILNAKIQGRNLIGKVEINHEVYGKEVVRVLESAHLSVSPGRVGLLAVESVSNMTPIVTHDDVINQMPEIEIIEDGVTGSFFKCNDISSLHHAVEFWYRIYEENRLDSTVFNKNYDIYSVQNQLRIFRRNLC